PLGVAAVRELERVAVLEVTPTQDCSAIAPASSATAISAVFSHRRRSPSEPQARRPATGNSHSAYSGALGKRGYSSAVEPVVETVMVTDAAPALTSTELLEREQCTPELLSELHTRATGPFKPFTGVTVTLNCSDPPAVTAALMGSTPSEKSGFGATTLMRALAVSVKPELSVAVSLSS